MPQGKCTKLCQWEKDAMENHTNLIQVADMGRSLRLQFCRLAVSLLNRPELAASYPNVKILTYFMRKEICFSVRDSLAKQMHRSQCFCL